MRFNDDEDDKDDDNDIQFQKSHETSSSLFQ